MSQGVWSARADRVLAPLFLRGQPAPTKQQLRDAYPFGPRAYWPYKAWCARVKAWRRIHALGYSGPPATANPPRPMEIQDRETGDLFAGAST